MAIDIKHMTKLTSGELGTLHLTYLANSMSVAVFTYLERCTDDPDIRDILNVALKQSKSIVEDVSTFYSDEDIPVPAGFGPHDVVPDAPKLFSDVFHINYLSMLGQLGPIFYAMGLPSIAREDVQKFLNKALTSSVDLHTKVKNLMLEKGIYIRPPYFPSPTSVEFASDQTYLKKSRPLNAVELYHLHSNIQFCSIKTGLLVGFRQVTPSQELRQYFERGIQYNAKQVTVLSEIMAGDKVAFVTQTGHEVNTVTQPPFSDRLLLFQVTQLSSAKARNYGDAISVSARHDLGIMYFRLMTETGLYAEDGANLLIKHGWLEKIPQLPDRNNLVNKQ